jgi:hypothetical protein
MIVLFILSVPLCGALLTRASPDNSDAGTNLSAELCATLTSCPKDIDQYLQGHYGFRKQYILANSILKYALSSPTTSRAIYGLRGKLFYADESVLKQTAGTLFRKSELDSFVSIATTLQTNLARQGIAFIVAPLPNPHTIEDDLLPAWLRLAPDSDSELSYALRSLEAQRILAVDLRNVLRKARSDGPVYRPTDTHWNFRGALLALNEILRASGMSGTQFELRESTEFVANSKAGDLARFLGVQDFLTEPSYRAMFSDNVQSKDASIALSSPDAPNVPGLPDVATETSTKGPRILVLGDSYTRDYWLRFLQERFSYVAWIHHRKCSFDYSVIAKTKPDIVIWAPVERMLPCSPGAIPKNLEIDCKSCGKTAAFPSPSLQFSQTHLDTQALRLDRVSSVVPIERGFGLVTQVDPKIYIEPREGHSFSNCLEIRLNVNIRSEKNEVAQLFFIPSIAQTFSEMHSVKHSIPASNTQPYTLSIRIRSSSGFKSPIRFDPVYQNSHVELRDLTLECW